MIRGIRDCTDTAAVVVTRGLFAMHAGIAYADQSGAFHLLHLAMHEELAVTAPTDDWMYAVSALDDVDQLVLAGLCELRASLGRHVPYGFRLDVSKFAEDDGRFVTGPGEIGLTCATFVIAMFEWARVPLLDRPTWSMRGQERQEQDRAAQRQLVGWMAERRRAPPNHIEALRQEEGCVRFRAEEVAAASAMSGRPVPYQFAAPAGARLLADFLLAGI